MKTVETQTMPAHWASALINNDWSGLEYAGDAQELRDYLQANPELCNPVSCGEESTLEWFDFSPGVTLLTDCLEYAFLRGE